MSRRKIGIVFGIIFPGAELLRLVALALWTDHTYDARWHGEFGFKMRGPIRALVKLRWQPIIHRRFGCDLRNRELTRQNGRSGARRSLLKSMAGRNRFLLVERRMANDDNKKHDTDMIILHDRDLTRVFRDDLQNTQTNSGNAANAMTSAAAFWLRHSSLFRIRHSDFVIFAR